MQTITEEMGAPIWLSEKAQASTGIKNLHETLDALKDYEFEKKEGDYTLVRGAYWSYRNDYSMNWPMNQITTKASAALAAGCTMVLKPSEISPYCALLLAEIFDKAGVPAGVFNVVNGYGPIVGAALSEHPDVAMMSFTGSTEAGIAVAQASAVSVKRVHQELGGKSSNIILDDVADLEKSVKGGAGHCFLKFWTILQCTNKKYWFQKKITIKQLRLQSKLQIVLVLEIPKENLELDRLLISLNMKRS